MGMLEALKKKNRTVLEMHIGIISFGLVLAGIILILGQNLTDRLLSIAIGTGLAWLAVCHMYRTLDRALDLDEGGARAMIFRGYLIRYAAVLVLLAVLGVTGALSPLLVFLSYMGLKVGAYLQPFTHKLCNRIFHETDPIPTAILEEDEVQSGKGGDN